MTIPPGSRPPLPHLAYLEALAQTTEASARWSSVTAGYAALQIFEVWAGCGGGTVALNRMEIRRVRKRIEAITESDPIRRCLTHLVDVVERTPTPHGSDEHRIRGYEVGRVLAAYGKLLQYEASWSLAHDVHETLIAYAQCVDDEERLLDSMLMVGFSLRMLARFDDARDAYGRLRATASDLGSEQYLLLSELGFAKIAIERGNLPAAAGMLDQILVDTKREELSVIRAKALMDRARVADQLGDLSSAAILSHQALELCTDPMDRERILVNIGMALTKLGLWVQARDAYMLLSATAQESAVRWMSRINLIELAYFENSELAFEQYRRDVGAEPLPPYLAAVFHETCAHGFAVFGRIGEATRSFEQMLDVAERHGLNEFAIKAASALEDVRQTATRAMDRPRCSVDDQPPEVATVAHAITELRSLAGL